MIARAILAVPGDLATPTGGYAYARQLLAGAKAAGLDLVHWPLPGEWPSPGAGDVAQTARCLASMPTGWPVIIDGLALGAMPEHVLQQLQGPLVALCHHPLALETGIDPELAIRLEASERLALSHAARVLTTSRTTAATLVADYGVAPDRITVAPPGTPEFPRATGSSGLEAQLLSVGTLVPRKGHDRLISALGRLAHLGWHLTIVGAEDRDPAHARELKALTAQHGLVDRIRFHGPADADGLAELWSGADIFALASRYEGFGMVYAEALAHGLPVIGTRAGAIPEATMGAALLVDPDDEEALTEALRTMITDLAARRSLADRAWSAAQDLPRWPDTVRAVAAMLVELADEATHGLAATGAT
ncbi:glycosyltransferase family 4 protein [Limibaculum sp. M0105]|uniref:Glycosyltransferase family 4 protein n=1 Tax=Thermohalobaculum xanthum TaxID=2753746 RepID=A0A8J7SET8_9RHOB|nr:glycosyltransferase family 4 protein [Thermohalobaculum xanthum]MBK0399721.1 glycosyltransferase family 4 protein [Thermohalobaculum xanthum]